MTKKAVSPMTTPVKDKADEDGATGGRCGVGFVSLVGAGPGDAELLTLKAHRLICNADVVVYDRLVSREVLDLIPTGVSRISVGKKPGHHCVPQEQINEIIVALAKSGRNVVRLKGGDPYLFGRGGEEAIALKVYEIPFQVVPGITAASGCGAYSGIPLTHRAMSRRVQFITGHFNDGEPLEINWHSVADPDSTLVIYMGLSNLSYIAQSLMDVGLPGSTPAAAIQDGTTPIQRKIITSLSGLQAAVEKENLITPLMIIIGKTVTLAQELDWYVEQQQAQQQTQQNQDDQAVGRMQARKGSVS